MRRSFSVLVLLACSAAWAEDRPVLIPREQPTQLWAADDHAVVATAAVAGAVVTTLIAVAIALAMPQLQRPTGLKFPNSTAPIGP